MFVQKTKQNMSSVLIRLEQFCSANPRAEEVSLEGQGIDSLVLLVPVLAQLPRLKRLKLGGNHLTSLPEDLSSLRGIEALDISGNPVSGLGAVIRGLFCLGNLRHLSIDLPLETDEDEIIVSLTSLESFNGTPLTEGASGGHATNRLVRKRWSEIRKARHATAMSDMQTAIARMRQSAELADVEASNPMSDMQSMDVMRDHIRGITSDMHSLIAAMSDMQTAIVRMSVELADMKASILLLESAAKAPSAFWAQLLVASSADPAVQSTTVAFKVVPLAADVDGLKDAVAAKTRLSVAVPFLKVWAHDAASNRWVPVDEDSALVANDKATAYHVVVPKA